MQAFLVGLLFLFGMIVLVAMGILLFPLMLVTGVILWGIGIVALFILAIWLLGKVIIFGWKNFFKGKD